MTVRSGLLVLVGLLCVSLSGAAWAGGDDLLGQGIKEYKSENYEEALAVLTQAQAAGANGTVSYYLGMTCKRMGDYRAALHHLENARRLGTTEPGLYRELADCNCAIPATFGSAAPAWAKAASAPS